MSVLEDVTLSLGVIRNAAYEILTITYFCSTLSLQFFFPRQGLKPTREVGDALSCKERSI